MPNLLKKWNIRSDDHKPSPTPPKLQVIDYAAQAAEAAKKAAEEAAARKEAVDFYPRDEECADSSDDANPSTAENSHQDTLISENIEAHLG